MAPQTNESQADITPEGAKQLLIEGNQRFREAKRLQRDLLAEVDQTKGGQAPFAVVLSCIDSRVPVELVFDQGIGDIFSARVAGNCVSDDLLGSLEFATKVAGSKLVVVLGHSNCGAIKGACDDVQLGHLSGLLAHIKPAVEAVVDPEDPAERTSKNPTFVQAVVEQNVDVAVGDLRRKSEILRGQEEAGEIAIVGAVYDVASGAVEFR